MNFYFLPLKLWDEVCIVPQGWNQHVTLPPGFPLVLTDTDRWGTVN